MIRDGARVTGHDTRIHNRGSYHLVETGFIFILARFRDISLISIVRQRRLLTGMPFFLESY